ncbi:hypothetical protein I203_100953 [Kwoniella mangroviensis CBS 8507]|uniref:uncharacterized protein n=1 Tax=Kwoniella mangroviensis CBS 8507 TaxID=1296122 RepID=UPI00080CDEB0|nr:uncharacterized protein I203_02594 [Kwoniella mangroviensis CBS 8507]OCF67936.1 hypothetical protein I203_02594 [Kwoniella mangroviensis CBS 8507]
MGIKFDAQGNFLIGWDQGQSKNDSNLWLASGRASPSNFVERSIDLGPGEGFGDDVDHSTYWLSRGRGLTSSIIKVTARDQRHSAEVMEGTLSPFTCPTLTLGHYVFSVASKEPPSDAETPDEAALGSQLLTELDQATNNSACAS